MKKYLALLAALILVFTFVACGDDDDNGGGGVDDDATITLQQVYDGGKKTYDDEQTVIGIAVRAGYSLKNVYVQDLEKNFGIPVRMQDDVERDVYKNGDKVAITFKEVGEYGAMPQLLGDSITVIGTGTIQIDTITSNPTSGDVGKYVTYENRVLSSELDAGANATIDSLQFRNESDRKKANDGKVLTAGTWDFTGFIWQYNANLQFMLYDRDAQVSK